MLKYSSLVHSSDRHDAGTLSLVLLLDMEPKQTDDLLLPFT